MRFDVISLFPDFYTSPLQSGLIGKALDKGIAQVQVTNPRDFTHDKHRKVDDDPYGGGAGMVMKVAPVVEAVESLPVLSPRQVLLLTPQGQPMTQAQFHRWSRCAQLVLICGHYEGIDERVTQIVTQEVSLGDFVLTTGDIPALTLLNGVIRLLPGTVGKVASLQHDSFEDGLLDYPHYTRPEAFRGQPVPAVLRSGDHGAIARWRRAQQIERTQQRRPDLYDRWQRLQTEPTLEDPGPPADTLAGPTHSSEHPAVD
ncbi:MAG: tRNA (guanosine(37)-N1)-methyltransferase TrmD [Cyanobacteria bacterium P01_A01_bin.105]